LNLSVPSGLNALKLGGPPGPAATAYSSSVTRRAFENSDVSPLFKFVAVAVTNFPARLPAATATGVNTPDGGIWIVCDVRKVSPSPKPLGSAAELEKNSNR